MILRQLPACDVPSWPDAVRALHKIKPFIQVPIDDRGSAKEVEEEEETDPCALCARA